MSELEVYCRTCRDIHSESVPCPHISEKDARIAALEAELKSCADVSLGLAACIQARDQANDNAARLARERDELIEQQSDHAEEIADLKDELSATKKQMTDIREGLIAELNAKSLEIESLKRGPDDEAVREAMVWVDAADVREEIKVLAASCRKAWARVAELEADYRHEEEPGCECYRCTLNLLDRTSASEEKAERDLAEARNREVEHARMFGESAAVLIRERDEAKALVSEFHSYREKMGPALKDALAEVERLRAALESIAANTCCAPCQEARLVARKALSPNTCAECCGNGWVIAESNLHLTSTKPCRACRPPKPDEGKQPPCGVCGQEMASLQQFTYHKCPGAGEGKR